MAKIMKTIFIGALLVCPVLAWGQWTSDGEIIRDEVGPIFDEIIVQDRTEGTFVFWTDYRNGMLSIYGQKVDTAGNQLWQSQGEFIGYTTIYFPNATVAVPDGEGGAIIAWPNYTESHTGIYAQRISGYGELLWSDTGLAVADWYGGQSQVAICSDSAGGAVLCWSGDSTGARRMIAQRLDGQGNKLWGEYGVKLSPSVNADQRIPKITTAVDSSIYCAWNDERTGDPGSGLYTQKLDLNGSILWGDSARALAAPLVGTIGTYAITPDTNWGFYCIWNDGRPQGADLRIYLQHINSEGLILRPWCRDGLEISYDIYSIEPFITIADDYRAIVSWQSDLANIAYCNIVDIWGEKQWPNGYVVANNIVQNKGLTKSAQNQFEVCIRGHNTQKMVYKLDEQGNFIFGNDGVLFGIPLEGAYHIYTVPDGFGGVVILTKEYNYGPLRLHKVYYNGHVGGVTGINDRPTMPEAFTLQTYPNPFNNGLNLKLALQSEQDVNLEVFDILGRKIKEVMVGRIKPGRTVLHYDSATLGLTTSGQYFLVLRMGFDMAVTKIAYLK